MNYRGAPKGTLPDIRDELGAPAHTHATTARAARAGVSAPRVQKERVSERGLSASLIGAPCALAAHLRRGFGC
jgi:hypothetical protein